MQRSLVHTTNFSRLFLTALFCLSCAAPLRFNPGLEIIHHKSVTPLSLPDSLRSVIRITLFEGKLKSSLNCVVSAIPRMKYKMDFKGPLGAHLGSFLWVKDSLWCLYLPEREIFYQGREETVVLPNLNLDSIPIGLLLEFLWGHIIQEGVYKPTLSKGRYKNYRSLKTSMDFRIDSKTGFVQACSYNSYVLVFDDYRLINQRVAPKKSFLYQDGKLLLAIQVKWVKDNPQWKINPFHLRLPKGLYPKLPTLGETGES